MPTTVRLDPQIERRLDALTHATGRSKASFIRAMIERGLVEEELKYGLDAQRSRKLSLFDELTATVEAASADRAWPTGVNDKELLGQERMRRFG